ncbi:hypothetical protein MC885_015551, partial [Smutsia gigantea]
MEGGQEASPSSAHSSSACSPSPSIPRNLIPVEAAAEAGSRIIIPTQVAVLTPQDASGKVELNRRLTALSSGWSPQLLGWA